jgi:hypothetical protein
MSLRRGFKANANRISVRLRESLGLRPDAPIDLTAIAARLGITIVPLSSFAAEHTAAVCRLMQIDPSAFSAATLDVEGGKRIILYNDAHELGRQTNSIAHEIAHVLLGHRSTLPIDTSGIRALDRDVEDEANWLGSTILISDAAALRILRDHLDTDAACALYKVSAAVLRMRINASGAVIRMKRSYQ